MAVLAAAILFSALAANVRADLVITEIQSSQAASGMNDFWELTNTGTNSVDLSNWKWNDSARVASGSAVTIPAATTIAAGESVIFTALTPTAFRTWWGIANTVQVISTGAAPGLGQNDAVSLFDNTGAEVAFLSYAANGFTNSSGSGAAGGHAGLSAGGASATVALVLHPTFGTTPAGRRYTGATVGTSGAFASAVNASDIGSPGVSGLSGGGPTITLTVSIAPSSFNESATNPAAVGTVTRSGSTDANLSVNLSSSDITEATVPATVTILATQASATFNVTAVDDSFPDGTKSVTISAAAPGATPGTTNISVLDDGDVAPGSALMLTELLSNETSGAPAGANDYWELTNFGTNAMNLAGYTWHDNGRSDAAASAYALPPGSSINTNESVIFTATDPAVFRAWWGISNTVQVFQTTGAPGLGQADGVSFFDGGGNELFFFSYAANGFTREDGSPSTGGHAGPSAGASADQVALIWVPSSGTTTPRYTFATGSNYGSFSAVSPATDLGSPGKTDGVVTPTVSLANASLTEGNSGTAVLSLPVTRSDINTAFTVDYAVTGGSANSGSDYVALAAGTLTFTAGGAASQTIALTVIGDTTPETNETIIVTLSNLTNTTGTTVIGTATGTGTILNDDPTGPVFTSQPRSTLIGNGAAATLTASATGIPAPTFQWYGGTSGDTNNPATLATNASFTTPALTTTTSYWVRASNLSGAADSTNAVVTVLPPLTAVDLSTYVRVARYGLPEPTRTTPPNSTNLLCQEASGVAYNWDSDTLFIVGDGGRSVTEVSKTGALVSTMTMALGSSPQGTDFYDPEGITYIGGGQFVFSEERDRQLVKFTYAAGTVLSRGNSQTVKLGTFVGNVGIEGLSYDPQTSGFICVKEVTPMGVFQTTVDFNAGTASNGDSNTVNNVNLFDPALLGFTDLADVFALSNLPGLTNGPEAGNLLLLSQEDAKILEVDRSGNLLSSLNIVADFGSPISSPAMQHEGLTMDRAGFLYVVNENAGGDINYPELWVYAPATVTNQAPITMVLTNQILAIAETASTASRIKVADIFVFDDGIGTNVLNVSGADAASFEATNSALYLKAGVVLDYETQTSYSITVNVDDLSVGSTPDATAGYSLTVTDVVNENPAAVALIISEVAPWSSGNSPVGVDWFEVSNLGSNVVSIAGWKVDDNSGSFGSAGPLSGVTNIAPGESVIFLDTASLATLKPIFLSNWFGANPPASLQIGSYTGAGGLGTGGDQVNLFNSNGTVQAQVAFGVSATGPFATFDNAAGLNVTNVNLTRLSVPRVYGAFIAANNFNEIGSPGSIGGLIISEIAPWSSGNSPVASDWFEVINTSPNAINLTGWKVDDDSKAFASAVLLNGVTNIAPGEAVIFMDTGTLAAKAELFRSNWFGATLPAGLQIGSYTGAGGLGTGGDQVNLFDGLGTLRASVAFGQSPVAAPFTTFENSFGLNHTAISQFSAVGVHGAFVAVHSANEVGSPGTGGKLVISEVAPWSSGSSAVGADWFELSNTGATPLDITGWKMDDNSQSPAGAVALMGITSLAPGESVIFIETTNLVSGRTAFASNWFGGTLPTGLQVGSYTGAGVGLSSGGDAVNIYSSSNVLQASVSFGASPGGPFATFDNGAGVNGGAITQLSSVGVNGAFVAVNSPVEIGSPGILTVPGLTLTRSGDNVRLRWSVEATGYRLEDTSTLTVPASWTGVGQSVVLTNGQLAVTVPISSELRFFRLRKP